MNITFGIIVGPNHEPAIVRKLIDSIFDQDFEDNDYEIKWISDIIEPNINYIVTPK